MSVMLTKRNHHNRHYYTTLILLLWNYTQVSVAHAFSLFEKRISPTSPCCNNLALLVKSQSETIQYELSLKQQPFVYTRNHAERSNTSSARMSHIERGGNSETSPPSTRWTNNFSPTSLNKEIQHQFKIRVAADPDFAQKSIVEVVFAILMQFTVELGKRGPNLLAEIDFVIAGILTAMAGKYYSMWRLAKTISHGDDKYSSSSPWRHNVPTNAFQETLLDGKTIPKMSQRLAALFVPMPSLFQAGFIASLIGYGFAALLIAVRTMLIPSYETATVSMNIFHACLYTGGFMAIVSNIRYQILQGLIEPVLVEKIFANYPAVKTAVISLIRLANGLLGSFLAITGMKLLGLQKLK